MSGKRAVIYLGRQLPASSSGLPEGQEPSQLRAVLHGHTLCLALLRMGFARPAQSPGLPVVSYTTVSPLPLGEADRRSAFCCTIPSGRPAWTLSSILLCGARTFLGRRTPPATARPA